MIKVGTLAKIRRLYFLNKLPIKEICRQTGLPRNAVRTWLKADTGRNKHEWRTKGVDFKPKSLPGLQAR